MIQATLSMFSTTTTTSLFKVKYLQYGYFFNQQWHPASWKTMEVKASCPKEAINLAKKRHRRAGQFSVLSE